MKEKGLFVTIDGPNGVGKSSIVNGLEIHLGQLGIDFLTTVEPTRSQLGSLVREMENKYQGIVYACLIAADRYLHLEAEVIPALQQGKVVISNRYVASSLVLQRLDNVDINFIWEINSSIIMPDISIILTAPEDVLETRLAQRSEFSRFERTISRSVELECFIEAADFLSNHGISTLLIDNNESSVDDNVIRIGSMILNALNRGRK